MTRSLRVRRMQRNHKRMAKAAKLNLVALMDIFTILVLFLIVNNGDVEVLETDTAVVLPESVSEQRPEIAAIIKISQNDIYFQDQAVINVAEALAGEEDIVASLASAMRDLAQRTTADNPHPDGRPVIIMGDQSTPYALLKRIMATCAATDFRDVSLAVNSAPPARPSESATTRATGSAPTTGTTL